MSKGNTQSWRQTENIHYRLQRRAYPEIGKNGK